MTEYVVKLGTQIDNAGFQQLLSLLDSTKLKALGITAALTAATTAIYKFASATAQQEFELKKLAKAQGMSADAMNAQNKALSAMGMTLQEVKKDNDLHKIYKEIVAFNKEMELPNIDKTLSRVREMQGAFWKLKSTINYAVQAIGRQVLINLEAPIRRITGYMGDISQWIKKNFTTITSRISVFISDFAKGIIGIGEAFKYIADMVGQLPDGIKKIALAIGIVAALINAGPLGRLLALVTLLGDVIHDAEVYQWNQQNRKTKEYVDEKGNPIQVEVALPEVWDVVFGEGDEKEKAKTVSGKIIKIITDALQDLSDFLASQENLSGLFGGEDSVLGKILSGIREYFTSPEGLTAVGNMMGGLFTAVSQVMATAGSWGASGVQNLAGIIASVFDKGDIWKDSKLKEVLNGKNGIVNGIFGAIELSAIGASPLVSIIGGVLGGYKTERNKALQELWKEDNAEIPADLMESVLKGIPMSELEKMYKDDPRLKEKFTYGLQDSFNQFISGILEGLTGGIKLAGNVAGDLLKNILLAIFGSTEDDANNTMTSALNALGDNNVIWNGFATALSTWIASGDFLLGLFAGIGTTLVSAENEDQLKKAADGILEMFYTIWDGAWEDETHTKRTGKGLHALLKNIWEGSEDQQGLKSLFDGLAETIEGWLKPVEDAIVNVFNRAIGRIKEALPQWLIDMFNLDENAKVTYTKNGDGSITITKDTGESYTGGQETGEYAEQKGLKVLRDREYGGFGIEETMLGGIVPAGFIEELHDYNINGVREGDEVDANLHASNYAQAMRAAYEDNDLRALKYLTSLYTPGMSKGKNIFGGETWTNWLGDIEGKLRDYKENGIPTDWVEPLEEGAEGASSSLEGVSGKVQALGSAMDSLASRANQAADALKSIQAPEDPKGPKAWGGRIGSAGNYLVGEDGPEYIIPITKPERAAALIQQMFGEMGASAVSRVMEGLGLGQTGTYGANLSSLSSAMNGMAMSNNFNINAPVNINVNSSGASAEDIGSKVYDMAERHLIKNVMGVYA